MTGNDQNLRQQENREWADSLHQVFQSQGPQRVEALLEQLRLQAQSYGIHFRSAPATPYINTIPASAQPAYPGRRDMERRLKSIIRWNAMAMVVRANREEKIGRASCRERVYDDV